MPPTKSLGFGRWQSAIRVKWSSKLTPAQIRDVIPDVEATLSWSPQYQSTEILDTDAGGRPRQVKMKVQSAGIIDEQVIEYTWTDCKVSWTLISAGQSKAQDASYTLTLDGESQGPFRNQGRPVGAAAGFVLKGAMETATDGLRNQVLNVAKAGN